VRRPVLASILVMGLVVPFVRKPVHIDDANFLHLARGAAADWWRPHDVTLNWQGTTERAFDVLSNPPGIAWWLAPVHELSEPVLHLWMLPWLLLALWGCWRLGQVLVPASQGGGLASLLVLGTCPVVLLASQALTPDLPLFACTVAGIGGFLGARRHAWPFALLAGCAFWFRYSGLCLVPLLLLAGWQRRRLAQAAAVVVAPALLVAHDLSAYGQVHATAMIGFQAVSDTPRDLLRKGAASVAMLGGAGLLPVIAWNSRSLEGAALGLVLGAAAAGLSQQSGLPLVATLVFATAGGATFSVLRQRHRDDLLLACWGLGGLAFLLLLRFSATRYWLPFLPAFALAALRLAPGRRRLMVHVALSAALALSLSFDDQALARAQRDAARRVAQAVGQPGVFAGHWGWQHYLEAAGWEAIEEDGPVTAPLAIAAAPWPQSPASDACLEQVLAFDIDDHSWGPRVHTAAGGANLHAFLVSGSPPIETYAPWSFSDEPYERVVVYVPCGE